MVPTKSRQRPLYGPLATCVSVRDPKPRPVPNTTLLRCWVCLLKRKWGINVEGEFTPLRKIAYCHARGNITADETIEWKRIATYSIHVRSKGLATALVVTLRAYSSGLPAVKVSRPL